MELVKSMAHGNVICNWERAVKQLVKTRDVCVVWAVFSGAVLIATAVHYFTEKPKCMPVHQIVRNYRTALFN